MECLKNNMPVGGLNKQDTLTTEARDEAAKEYFRLTGLQHLTQTDSERLAVILELALLDEKLDEIVQKCDDFFSSFGKEIQNYSLQGILKVDPPSLSKDDCRRLLQAISTDDSFIPETPRIS